jgi:hypothetical protein
MQNISHSKKVIGIYLIQNLKSNKRYVGSSVNIYYRIARHRADLRKGQHQNKHLQSAFNKYGEEMFVITVLEKCEPEVLLQREQFYVDTLRPEYNNVLDVIRNTLTEESRKKISATLKSKYSTGELVTYKQLHNQKTVEKYSYDGKLLGTFMNCAEVSRSLGLTRNCINEAVRSTRLHCKGFQWKIKGSNKPILKFETPFSEGNTRVLVVTNKVTKEVSFYTSIKTFQLKTFPTCKTVYSLKRLQQELPKLIIAPIKSEELLGSLVIGNQQPSL